MSTLVNILHRLCIDHFGTLIFILHRWCIDWERFYTFHTCGAFPFKIYKLNNK